MEERLFLDGIKGVNNMEKIYILKTVKGFEFSKKDFKRWVSEKENLEKINKECNIEESQIIDSLQYIDDIDCKIKKSFFYPSLLTK